MRIVRVEHFGQLADSWVRFRDDEDAFVAILTGVGDVYCVGADLKKFITFVTDRAGHDWRYALDTTRIRDQLCFRPTETFASGSRTSRATSFIRASSVWEPDIPRYPRPLPSVLT